MKKISISLAQKTKKNGGSVQGTGPSDLTRRGERQTQESEKMTTLSRLRSKLLSSWVDKSINQRQIENPSILFFSQLKIISDDYLYMPYIYDVNPSTFK